MFDLTKIKAYSAGAILFLLLAFLSGVLFIFSFVNELFFQLCIFQLILLSIVGTAPIVVINILLFSIYLIDEDNQEWDDEVILMKFNGAALFGSLFTFPVIYLPIIINLFFSTSFKFGILIAVVIEVIVWLIMRRLSTSQK